MQPPRVSLLLALAAAWASLGCADLAVKTFRGFVKTMESLARLDPTAVARGVNSLPFEVYLPDPVLGTEPDFYIHSLDYGEQISLVHDHKAEVGGMTETLRVQTFQLPRELPPQLEPYGACELGRSDPRLCPVLLTTPRGRVVHRRYTGSYPTNFSFIADETLLLVSLGRHTEASGWSPVTLSPEEIAALVDAFAPVPRSALYGMRVKTSQDV